MIALSYTLNINPHYGHLVTLLNKTITNLYKDVSNEFRGNELTPNSDGYYMISLMSLIDYYFSINTALRYASRLLIYILFHVVSDVYVFS